MPRNTAQHRAVDPHPEHPGRRGFGLTGAYNQPRTGSVIDAALARIDRALADFNDELTPEQARQVRFSRDALGLTQLLAWLSRPARRMRQRMFDRSRSPSTPTTPPTFNPLFTGDPLLPNPLRSSPSQARTFFTSNAAGMDPWPAFRAAIFALPPVFLDQRTFFDRVRGAVTAYLAGEAVQVESGAMLRASSACIRRTGTGAMERLEALRTDGVWQRFVLQELVDYTIFYNGWVPLRGMASDLPRREQDVGIQWYFDSLKNALLIANECLEDRMRGTVVDAMGRTVLGPPQPAVIADPGRYLRDA